MPIPFEFDFKNPDYQKVFQWRIDKLKKIRENPESLLLLKKYYKDNIAQFIIDWGITIDPRNAERGLPVNIPFLLFQRQEEWVQWIIEKWKNGEPGLTDKSRDMGVSWLSACTAASLCLFNEGISIGFGSRKEEYVDKIGDPKSIFFKIRSFVNNLPVEFNNGWNEKKNSFHMRIMFPHTGSIITGEAGDNLGRGDRASIYFVDESAFLPHPEAVEAALSQTTNCRQDISTPRGMNNPFARKRWGGKIDVQSLHWRDHPGKDEGWYLKKCNEIDDPIIIAQELDLDYWNSVENTVIQSDWIQSSIDAHKKLNLEISGDRICALDIADQGKDINALSMRHGVLLEKIESWSGKDLDLFLTLKKAFLFCDDWEIEKLIYDADGLGASARGDSTVLNEKRSNAIEMVAFRGSGKVIDPKDDPFANDIVRGKSASRTNEDYFANYKAQSWWALRRRFQKTHRAVTTNKKDIHLDDIICIPSDITNSNGQSMLNKLISELIQPQFRQNNAGKIVIDKLPDGARSPNLADSIMMLFAPTKRARGFLNY